MKVVKKDGSIQDFCINKIILTLERVSDDIQEPFTESDIDNLSTGIEKDIMEFDSDSISSREIHEIVVDQLRKFGFSKAVKYYQEFTKEY